MRVDLLTKEYPPDVYGGAGVHVAELVRGAARAPTSTCGCSASAGRATSAASTGYPVPAELAGANAGAAHPRRRPGDRRRAARAPTSCTRTPGTPTSPATSRALLHGIPHVVTAHSLEPLRPWKAEQLGGGYALSSWIERTAFEAAAAVIAVSDGMRDDILRVLPVGRPRPRPGRPQRHRLSSAGAPRATTGRRARGSASTPTGPRRLRRPDHPAEGPAATCCAPRPSCRPRCSSCSAPARRTPRRSWPR